MPRDRRPNDQTMGGLADNKEWDDNGKEEEMPEVTSARIELIVCVRNEESPDDLGFQEARKIANDYVAANFPSERWLYDDAERKYYNEWSIIYTK